MAMASLLAPYHSAPGSRSSTPSHPPARSLLNLDCSADLQQYSRNLGPTAQDCRDTIQRFHHDFPGGMPRVDEQRREEPRHQITHVGVGYNPYASVPPPHTGRSTPNTTSNVRDISSNPYGPEIKAPRPERNVAQAFTHSFENSNPLPQGHMERRPYSRPEPVDQSSYPPALRACLERTSSQSQHLAYTDQNARYTVFYRLESSYMDNEMENISTHRSLQEANLKAAEYFMDEFGSVGIDPPKFEVSREGGLRCTVETDGSTGGRVLIYVSRDRD
ncbi:hypothetical protein P154DRAFT_528057 [Amniculicola lignicola CBS 123094]|uniref:Uncharacterized protein n=1 Tax=Amniculicola lignicola CBS 123094 TaxID=1392246 RepID=A0A6A5W1P9_9PLEO|nr:hypothetical protein P154DRAFT_528057 [Amniculicola lignicola CBS 123094]